MAEKTKIRAVSPNDLSVMKTIVDATKLFPSEMLDEMLFNYFENSSSRDIWLADEDESGVVAIAYCAPEKMTEGTWNLYLLAVHPSCQGEGRGKAMVSYLEEILVRQGERLLLIETSGFPQYERTQAFYRRCGYTEEARIREFYQAGEDRIIFRKALK